jgi:hypothetical protein
VDKKEKPTSSALFKLFKVWENRGKLWVEKNATPSLLIKISPSPCFEKIPTEILQIPTLIHTFSPTGGKKDYLGEKPQIGPFTNFVLVV